MEEIWLRAWVWKSRKPVIGKFLFLLVLGMLRLAMETCCYGCANLTFIGPFKAVDKFFQNASILMPVESASNSKKFVGMEYVSFVDVPGVSFLARESSGRTTKLTKHLFKSVINTWPLFLTAFLMAIIAGCVVWVLVRNAFLFTSNKICIKVVLKRLKVYPDLKCNLLTDLNIHNELCVFWR